jgi:hypothetical protein
MPKFRVEFSCEKGGVSIKPKDVELPLNKDQFTTAHLDLENAVYEESGDMHAAILSITALEDVPAPEGLHSGELHDASAIKPGDIVWRSWWPLIPDGTSDDKQTELMAALKSYKPLWEGGDGYSLVTELMTAD